MINTDPIGSIPVMLIDDCAIDNYINTKVLINYKFSNNVMIYDNPLKALAFLRAAGQEQKYTDQLPEFILLDLNMPLMNGYEFLKEFDRLPEKVRCTCKIVILSSSVDPLDMAKSLRNNNVISYFSKPLIKSNIDDLRVMAAEYSKIAVS